MWRIVFLSLLLIVSGNTACEASGMTLKEMRKDFVKGRTKIPLEEVGEYDMVFAISMGGFDWMYEAYGHTVRDRGITEKRPCWYFLRSLLTTFDPGKQARCTALSGVSMGDSLTLTHFRDAPIQLEDASRLMSVHYYLACGGRHKKATRAKHAWYALALANPTITFPFWRGRFVDEKMIMEQYADPTFAQMLINLGTPGKDGLEFFIPDINPRCFFLSDDPVIMQQQLKGRRIIIDP
jgi:hypothetical protein